ncbi:MAG TPA: cytochrome P450 [Lacipirellulaceae bacterium]|nr:cytochrome P450 [Lacipirellulaceae bacterium]
MSAAMVPESELASAGPALTASTEPVSQVDLADFSRDLFHGIRWLHERHGPIAAVEDGGQRVVFLFSPEFNQEVLSDTERFHARFFTVRGPKRSAQRRLTCGLLAMNGEQHRRNRRIVKEPFGLRAISGYADTIARLTDELLASWRPGDVRDIAEEMRQYMLRVTSTLLFGLNDSELAYRLGDMIARWVALNQDVGAGALVPNDRFFHHYEDLLAFAEELEAEILAMIRRRRESDKPVGDVLSLLVQMHDEEGGLSDEELVGQTAVLFGAAHMTTAHSLTWTLMLLAQHPSVMAQLWEELKGEQSGAENGTARCPFGRDTKALGSLPKGEELSLLDRVIKESMRILPASAYSQRINTVAVQLGPLFLPRGTGIVFAPLVTHHLPEVYSEPEHFLPDRWLTLRPSPYAYHPFGAGPRLCIGGPLATAIIRVALEKILLRYRLSLVPGSNIGVHVESTMLVPTSGLPMRIHAADGRFSANPIAGRIRELVDFDEAPELEAGAGHAAEQGEVSIVPRRPK